MALYRWFSNLNIQLRPAIWIPDTFFQPSSWHIHLDLDKSHLKLDLFRTKFLIFSPQILLFPQPPRFQQLKSAFFKFWILIFHLSNLSANLADVVFKIYSNLTTLHSISTTITLARTIFISHIDYCNNPFNGLPSSALCTASFPSPQHIYYILNILATIIFRDLNHFSYKSFDWFSSCPGKIFKGLAIFYKVTFWPYLFGLLVYYFHLAHSALAMLFSFLCLEHTKCALDTISFLWVIPLGREHFLKYPFTSLSFCSNVIFTVKSSLTTLFKIIYYLLVIFLQIFLLNFYLGVLFIF